MPHLPRLIIAANVMIDSGRFGNKKGGKNCLTLSVMQGAHALVAKRKFTVVKKCINLYTYM
jgi:hypothetical protein